MATVNSHATGAAYFLNDIERQLDEAHALSIVLADRLRAADDFISQQLANVLDGILEDRAAFNELRKVIVSGAGAEVSHG